MGEALGWGVAAVIVLAVGLDRIDVGAHWPSDVLAGLLIAIAWLSLVVSLKRVSDRAFGTTHDDDRPPARLSP